MADVTLYVIRTIVDYDESEHFAYKKGWYAAREYVKKDFKYARFFASVAKAKQYMRTTSSLRTPGFATKLPLSREECYEIVPVTVTEPS